jgi:hypothetical protein
MKLRLLVLLAVSIASGVANASLGDFFAGSPLDQTASDYREVLKSLSSYDHIADAAVKAIRSRQDDDPNRYVYEVDLQWPKSCVTYVSWVTRHSYGFGIQTREVENRSEVRTCLN